MSLRDVIGIRPADDDKTERDRAAALLDKPSKASEAKRAARRADDKA